MKKLSILLIFISLTVFFSCNKDDDNNAPVTPETTDPSEPNTITFDNISHTEFMLWIGGDEINTSGMDVADFYIDSDDGVNLGSLVLTFDEDSVEIGSNDQVSNNNLKLAYSVSNDSPISNLTVDIQGEPMTADIFLGMGTRYSLNVERHYLFTAIDFFGNENFRMGFSSFGFQTFESAGLQFQINSPADMGGSDTIMIYNQRALFN